MRENVRSTSVRKSNSNRNYNHAPQRKTGANRTSGSQKQTDGRRLSARNKETGVNRGRITKCEADVKKTNSLQMKTGANRTRTLKGEPGVIRTNPAHRTNTSRSIRRKTKTGLVKFTFAVLVVAAVVCMILVSNRSVINAEESGTPVKLEKYYKTITVQKGDSLWSIAKEYKSGDYRTVQDYVNELKSMNNLGSDQINAGNKLVIAYFTES